MHQNNTSIVKIIFDPDVYMSILCEILKITKSASISMYSMFLLNSMYVNEMLEEDIKWKDRNGDEHKEYVNRRVNSIVQLGVELVKSMPDNEIKRNEAKTSVRFNDNNETITYNDECNDICKDDANSLFDLVDSMPIDQDDEFYKKVKKLKEIDHDSTNAVSFN